MYLRKTKQAHKRVTDISLVFKELKRAVDPISCQSIIIIIGFLTETKQKWSIASQHVNVLLNH